jgi:hypothetical protein
MNTVQIVAPDNMYNVWDRHKRLFKCMQLM